MDMHYLGYILSMSLMQAAQRICQGICRISCAPGFRAGCPALPGMALAMPSTLVASPRVLAAL